MYQNPDIESSYRDNDLGKTLYDIVMEKKPKKIIEFGTLNGYSAVCMALALRDLKQGHIVSYDLWDEYKFKKGNRAEVQETINKLGLSEFITLKQGDFFHWLPEQCDLMHIDLSNDGEKLKKIKAIAQYSGADVYFEGGTAERDRAIWMIKYNRPTFASSGIKYDIIEIGRAHV